MRVKICKNCRFWRPRGGEMTAGNCRWNDHMQTLDLMHCSAFAYRPDADDYPSDGMLKGGGSRGGDDGPPVDITPRGPGGNQLEFKGYVISPNSGMTSVYTGYEPLALPYDPDGDKKD